jgi:hypothetical protein
MKTVRKNIKAVLLAAVVCLGLGACGTSDEGFAVDDGLNASLPGAVSVKTGSIASDSWGYTGAVPVQVAAPAKTEALITGHTLLMDASKVVVSGGAPTTVSFSSEITSLSATAQRSAPANFVSLVDIRIGSVKTVLPAISVTVDVGALPSGQILNVYNYDPGTGKWISAQTAVVSSSGKITFPVGQLSLWGIFQ